MHISTTFMNMAKFKQNEKKKAKKCFYLLCGNTKKPILYTPTELWLF